MPRTVTRTAESAEDTIESVLGSYQLSIEANGKSRATAAIYTLAMSYLDAYLAAQGMPRTLTGVRREHVESWLVALRDAGRSPATVSVYFRSAQAFFKWAIEEGLLAESPLRHMAAPLVPEKPVPLLSEADMRRLMATVRGSSFEDLRDNAILRLFADTGMRRGEMTGIAVDDIATVKAGRRAENTPAGYATITGKGRRQRTVVFGVRTAVAIDRYRRARAHHPFADDSAMWLGYRGPLTGDGIMQMVRRRGDQAGIAKLYPHRLRHTYAGTFAMAVAQGQGGSDSDLMALMGWKSPAMLRRYASAARMERAHAAAAKLAIGDRY